MARRGRYLAAFILFLIKGAWYRRLLFSIARRPWELFAINGDHLAIRAHSSQPDQPYSRSSTQFSARTAAMSSRKLVQASEPALQGTSDSAQLVLADDLKMMVRERKEWFNFRAHCIWSQKRPWFMDIFPATIFYVVRQMANRENTGRWTTQPR